MKQSQRNPLKKWNYISYSKNYSLEGIPEIVRKIMSLDELYLITATFIRRVKIGINRARIIVGRVNPYFTTFRAIELSCEITQNIRLARLLPMLAAI